MSTERKASIFNAVFRRVSSPNARGSRREGSLTEQGGWRAVKKRGRKGLNENDTIPMKADDDANATLVCSISDSPYYIYTACARGLTDVVHVLVSENPNKVHEPDANGRMCLHHAAANGKLEIMDILLREDADLNAQDQHGNTPLHTAVEKGQIEAARRLLSAGADANILNEHRLAPIHVATISNSPRLLEALLSFPKVVDVNCRGERGKRALHYAAKYDYAECVGILLRAGCRLCEPCDYGFYPTHTATMNSSVKSLEVMLLFGESAGFTRGCMLSYADKESNSPLHLAVNSGNYEIVRLCLEHGAKIDLRQESQSTAFHFACSQGTLPIVKLLFEHHLKQSGEAEGRKILASRDNADMTPLHRAAMFDHADVVKYLIDQGADINAIDRQKCTPVLLAAGKGATRSLRLLIEHGANITLRDLNQRHILHFPVMYSCPKLNQAMEMIDLICQREEGMQLLNMKDDFGRTPLHVASKEGHLKFADALMKFGAIITLKDNEDQSPLHFAARYGRYHTVRRLLDSPVGTNILNETDSAGMTSLHAASANGHLKVVELLLQRGALLHKNYLGQTPLHLATIAGYTSTMKLLLLFHPTLLDQKCAKGYTALHCATEENQADPAALLLSMNCSYCTNNEDLTPLDIAIQRRNVEVAVTMVQHDRWKEILRGGSSLYGCPLLGLIKHLPDVHKAVLDRCCTKSDSDTTSSDCWVRYNFEFLQIPLSRIKECRRKSSHAVAKPLMALNMMVRYGRVDLLSHPLCLNFMRMKWMAYGLWIFLIQMLLYSTFLGCLTVPVMAGSNVYVLEAVPPSTGLFGNESNVTDAGNTTLFSYTHSERKIERCRLSLSYVCIFAIANMLKELIQIYQQRLRYFADYINYVEWTIYITSTSFAGTAFWHEKTTESQWQCASVAIFLAWFNLLLYLQRLETVGLYVVMFLQILHTVLKVIVAFTALFVAFGLSFFMLLSATPNGSYRTPVFGILQALMELMGEYNYVDVYIRPYFQLDGARPLKYATMNFIFLVVFVVLMPILFVNLLIGLAVGDIEMVQRDARLKRLAMQVTYHTELEEKLPLCLLEKVDKSEMILSPCGLSKKGFISKMVDHMNWVCDTTLLRQTESIWRHSQQFEVSNDAIVEELDSLRRRMKEIQTQNDSMNDMLKLIVQKMEIVTEADAYEGRRSDDEEEDGSSAHRRRGMRLKAKLATLSLGKSTER